MGLFDKKFCDICGEKIGLLGNRKLEDGNLCKDCAAKLSPWFSDRRSSTVQDIRNQLEYREQNRERVAAFNTTRTIGDYYMVMLDEDKKQFCVAQARDIRTGNPDILDFSQVTGCDLDIDETKHEVYAKDADGKNVSYNPPRYDYSYDFYVQLRVNHPWFDEMRFKLNSSSVDIDYGSTMPGGAPAGRTAQSLQGAAKGGGEHPAAPSGQRPPMPPAGQRPPMPPSGQRPAGMRAFGTQKAFSGTFDPSNNAEYQQYVAMGSEIREVILQVRQEARDDIAAANAPKTAVQCPHCGASTIPDANGCCEFCGGAVNG